MGLFWDDPKPRVSLLEWQKVKTSLFDRGFNRKEIDLVEGFIQSSLNEPGKDAGLQEAEISQLVAWLRMNVKVHHMSEEKISSLERALREKL